MCGISGIYNFSGSAFDGEQHIAKMNRCVAHRGPDDEGIWQDKSGNLVFGHRRLSIIDLSDAGHQPMTDEFGNAIIFNGEIYNYKDLRSGIKGYNFRTNSDTEVLFELCRRKFKASHENLNGMFAYAYWDEQKQKLLLTRDRIGKKPLYYTISEGKLIFASEIKSILEVPGVLREPDLKSLYHFLTFNLIPDESTLFRNIYKLPPAGYLIAGKNGIEEKSTYWNVEYSDLSNNTEITLADNIYSLLDSSVEYRMTADVPVGAFLSGGVDSSAIVALMSEKGHKVKTYSIGFHAQPDYTELHHAEKIAVKYGTEHYEKIIKADDLRDLISKMAEIFDEPLADPTAIPIYFLSQLARNNGTIVVQTGDGSDELFAGYSNWKKYAGLEPFYRIYKSFPSGAKKTVASLFNNDSSYSPWKEFLNRAINNEEFYWGGARAFKESSKNQFLKSGVFKNENSHDIISKLKAEFNSLDKKGNDSYIDWMCYHGLRQQIPSRYLLRMDRLGMANSVEIRCPFLDVNLVNYAMSVPSVYKIKNGIPKYILKKSLERILPAEILYRKKMGFNVPLREWTHEYISGYVQSNLKQFCNESGVFDYESLNRMTAASYTNKNLSNNIFTLYFLISWYKRWIF